MSAPLFPPGQVGATPGALNATNSTFELLGLLARHIHGG